MKESEIKKFKINNLSIEYLTQGKGEDLLFIHGGAVSFRSYYHFLEEASKYYKVWTLSVPGAGKSSKLPDNWKFENYTEIVQKFAQEFRIKPILAGHSFGGAISIKTKSRFPEAFGALLLFSAAGAKFKNINNAVLYVIYMDLPLILKNIFKKRKSFKYKDKIINISDHFSDFPKISTMFNSLDLKGDMRSIRDKVLVFWGREDPVLPIECFEQMKKSFPNAKSFLLEGKHKICIDRADMIVRMMLEELGTG